MMRWSPLRADHKPSSSPTSGWLACRPDIGLLVEIGRVTSCNVGVEATNTDVLRATGPRRLLKMSEGLCW